MLLSDGPPPPPPNLPHNSRAAATAVGVAAAASAPVEGEKRSFLFSLGGKRGGGRNRSECGATQKGEKKNLELIGVAEMGFPTTLLLLFLLHFRRTKKKDEEWGSREGDKSYFPSAPPPFPHIYIYIVYHFFGSVFFSRPVSDTARPGGERVPLYQSASLFL